MIIHNDVSPTRTESFFNLMSYIRKAYFAQNTAEIMNLLSANSSFKLNPFEKTMIKSIVHTLDSNVCPTREEIAQLVDYLFKIEKWGYYEITLLGNCVETIPYDSLFLLTKEILKNSIYYSLNKNNKRLVTRLAINCLTISIDEKEFANCEYLIQEIKNLLSNELNYYEQTVFLYFEFMKGKHDGIEKMTKALQIFSILGDESLKGLYINHFSKHVDIWLRTPKNPSPKSYFQALGEGFFVTVSVNSLFISGKPLVRRRLPVHHSGSAWPGQQLSSSLATGRPPF